MYSPPVRPASGMSQRDGTTPAPPASINNMSTEMIEGMSGLAERGYIPDEMVNNINDRYFCLTV